MMFNIQKKNFANLLCLLILIAPAACSGEEDPTPISGMALYDKVMTDFQYFDDGSIYIAGPELFEKGTVVPINVYLSGKKGNLWIFIDSNDEKTAAKVEFLQAENEGRFNTRIKMKDSGNVIIIFEDIAGNLSAAQRWIKINQGFVPESCSTLQNCPGKFEDRDIKLKYNGKMLRMMASNEMNKGDYIMLSSIYLDNTLVARVHFTPYIAKNPYFGISHSKNSGSAISVIMQANQRRRASKTINL